MGSDRMMSARRDNHMRNFPVTRRRNSNQVGDAMRRGASCHDEERRRDDCAARG